MKKILIIFLAIVMMFTCLVACGDKKEEAFEEVPSVVSVEPSGEFTGEPTGEIGE